MTEEYNEQSEFDKNEEEEEAKKMARIMEKMLKNMDPRIRNVFFETPPPNEVQGKSGLHYQVQEPIEKSSDMGDYVTTDDLEDMVRPMPCSRPSLGEVHQVITFQLRQNIIKVAQALSCYDEIDQITIAAVAKSGKTYSASLNLAITTSTH